MRKYFPIMNTIVTACLLSIFISFSLLTSCEPGTIKDANTNTPIDPAERVDIKDKVTIQHFYYKDIHYIIASRGEGGVDIQNYTQDSTEFEINKQFNNANDNSR